ncbi:RNA exonuclease 3 [Thelotrema lepadinum]|nr:RNA exonuclease 3 [Thelotrema lepadinum]
MFSSLGLFKKIQCPKGEKCQLPVCGFLHDVNGIKVIGEGIPAIVYADPPDTARADNEPPTKRQRTEASSKSSTSAQGQKDASTTKSTKPAEAQANGQKARQRITDKANKPSNLFTHLERDISPPPLNGSSDNGTSRLARSEEEKKRKSVPSVSEAERPRKVVKKESLNPRQLSKPPAPHATRYKLLTLIHEQMSRLNDEVKKSSEAFKNALQLSADEIISLALDEEERIAKTNGSVYLNVMKHRIVALKKFKLEDWKDERVKQIEKSNRKIFPHGQKADGKNKTPRVYTGLSSEAEIAILPNLITPQEGLEKHGYVPSIPLANEIEEAREGVDAAKNWELCERCKTRFQVFPGRRESDGALTTGGSCRHHWGRARRPPIEKGKPVRPEEYTCCRQEVGTPGCTTTSTHVFRVSEAKRLAFVLPFEKTPSAKSTSSKRAPVCFDCEMGYTTYGTELIRLSAVSWPSGDPLLDVLVRPLGEVLDLNSRFSGVWPDAFTGAKPWNSKDLPPALAPKPDATKPSSEGSLHIVPNPQHARSLLFSLLTPNTPLIGHALENDLNAARIVHPTIIDTMLLYPHPAGLPARFGLKNLSQKEIEWEIQTGGDMGHDSMEDSRAAGELVRLAVKRKWKEMESDGWRVEGSVFHAP